VITVHDIVTWHCGYSAVSRHCHHYRSVLWLGMSLVFIYLTLLFGLLPLYWYDGRWTLLTEVALEQLIW